ncbi:MAG TPA: DUF1611 domain-containing protein [Candidatus Thermoplasmatota archaeon]|nr:DUF1611 domain-containing protein [Candidatus Thermoplasmatota archaeon]
MGKARRRKAGARSPEGRPALPKRKAAAPSDALDFQNAKVGTADANAVILCEGALATPTGKTGNGLLRRSRRYKVRGVIDSRHAGKDAGEVLDGVPSGIPVFASVDDALSRDPSIQTMIFGLATDGGMLPREMRPAMRRAIERGLNIVSGLHEFISDDPEFAQLASRRGVDIFDIRKLPLLRPPHFYTGAIAGVRATVIAALGTDSAIGKRTTAWKVVEALEARGRRAHMIATGQTGIMQGAKYGFVLDSTVNDYVAGEIEWAVVECDRLEKPDVIVLEGQGALTHPAYPGGFELIAAGQPRGILVQHAPARETLDGFPMYKMADLSREIRLLEAFSEKPVIAITLNHEDMTRAEVDKTVREYEARFGVPCCDPLWHGADKVAAEIERRFLKD